MHSSMEWRLKRSNPLNGRMSNLLLRAASYLFSLSQRLADTKLSYLGERHFDIVWPPSSDIKPIEISFPDPRTFDESKNITMISLVPSGVMGTKLMTVWQWSSGPTGLTSPNYPTEMRTTFVVMLAR